MSWYNAQGKKAPDVVNITIDGKTGTSFNPAENPAWREENGYIYDTPPVQPAPPQDGERAAREAEFADACAKFREVCAAIGAAIGDPAFRGGFEEMEKLQQSAIWGTIAGLQLAQAWSAANDLCVYLGKKLGLDQPKWWYRCWAGIVTPAASGEETEPTGEDDPPPMEEPLIYQEEIDAQGGE